MDEALSKLAADSGRLATVRGRASSAVGYHELAFIFERGTLCLTCDVVADEVLASTDGAADDLRELDVEALVSLGGRVVEQAWTMMNHRGFSDGFQIRLIDLDTREEGCVQVEAAAGVLMLSLVAPLWRHS